MAKPFGHCLLEILEVQAALDALVRVHEIVIVKLKLIHVVHEGPLVFGWWFRLLQVLIVGLVELGQESIVLVQVDRIIATLKPERDIILMIKIDKLREARLLADPWPHDLWIINRLYGACLEVSEDVLHILILN